MSYKKILNLFIVLSVIAIVSGYILFYPEQLGICMRDTDDDICGAPLARNIGEPLVLGAIPLSLVFLLLRFLPPQYFSAWLKFGTWYIPLAAIAIIWAPVSGGDLFSFDKESVTWFFSGLYVIVCVVIILIKFVAGRMRGLPPPLIKGD